MLPILSSLLLSTMALASSPRVLVYTRTAGYRHESIPTAIQALGDHQQEYNVTFVFTEDQNMFTTDQLSGFDGVMFVSTTDEVLDDAGKAALATYFQSGGVYTGVHAGSACLFNDTNYQQAVGALFDYHPTLQNATFERLNTTHPATAHLPDRWNIEDEVYHFRSDPRTNGAVVLLTVDESSYVLDGSSTGNYPPQGDPHPIAWYIESPLSAQPLRDGAPKPGRSFYTSLGHLGSTWLDDTFITHVMLGLRWALDGASTRAYGVGLVGNNSDTTSTASPSAGPSSSSTASTTHSPSSAGSGATLPASASASGASGAAGRAKAVPSGVVGAAAVLGGAAAAGLALVL